MSTLDMALLYDHFGCSVLPLKSRSKEPGVRTWKEYQSRRPERDELRKWFSGGRRNIGIICGDVSGRLIVRDFDSDASYENWQSEYPEAATSLPTVRTARGFHVYARSAESIPSRHLGDGEIRSNGHYVAAPPSIHPSGNAYTWTRLPDDIPVVDFVAAGLLTDWKACNTENTEDTEHTDKWHAFSVFSALSVSSVLHESIEQAVKRTIPPGPGRRERKLFELARELKAFSELAELPVKSFKPIVKQWHKLALPYIRTKPFTDTWFAFTRAWDRVKFPKGSDPISEAYARAVESDTPPDCDEYDIEAVVNLVKLCRQLQAMAGDKAFYLDCRTAGQLIGVDHTTAWRWLRGLAHDRVIEVVSTGSKTSRKANEYRYLAND